MSVRESVSGLPELVKPIVRVIIASIILGIVKFVVRELPMFQGLWIPGSPFSASMIVDTAISLFMIVIVLNFGREFGRQLRVRFPTFPESARIILSLVYIVVVVFAYDAFYEVARFYLTWEFMWIYSALFVLLVIVPLYSFGTTLYSNIHKLTDLFTYKVAEVTERPSIEPELDVTSQYKETARVLDSLNRRLAEGAITEETYKKLKSEFELNLGKTRERVEAEVDRVQREILDLKNEKSSKDKEMEELRARQMIGQISMDTFERQRIALERDMRRLDDKISSKEDRLRELQELLK